MRRLVVALQVEQPQPRITVGGVVLPGAVRVEVESLAYFAADRFSVDLAIGADAAATAGFYSSLGAGTIEIELSLGSSGFTTILVGQIDNVRTDLLSCVATLRGRDLAARLIDAEISEPFVNQTSSQIAEIIAARHGLTAQVAPTATPVGQYYELDHARYALGIGARASSEWNLLAWLAEIETFALSVTGTTLIFGPWPQAEPSLINLSDLMTLTLDVATTVPSNAVVKSWNSRNKAVVSGTAGTGAGASTTLVRPNLTAAQAQTFADSHLSTLASHGVILTATMPGELTLMPNSQIALVGTNSAFDQNYRIDGVRRSVDSRGGFTQTVRAHAVTS